MHAVTRMTFLGLRMAIHDTFEGAGVDTNRVCDLLIVAHPPILEWDCCRLEMVANLMDLEPQTVSGR
jgi:hypothetical protein